MRSQCARTRLKEFTAPQDVFGKPTSFARLAGWVGNRLPSAAEVQLTSSHPLRSSHYVEGC